MPDINRTTSQDRWLRFYNNVLYEVFPAAYNAIDRFTFGTWWRLVRRGLDFVPEGGRLLEVGFGPGRLHAALAERAELCVGLDLAWGMCRFTQRRLRQAGLPRRIVQGSVLKLPFPDRSFNTIVSTFAFSGVPSGEHTMAEMARVANLGGCVVLVDIGIPQNANRMGTMLARLWERMGDYLYNQPQMMQDAGLVVTTLEEFGPGDHIRAVVGQKRRI